MGINSNLHLVMFHIWTLNVLREKRKLKIHTQLHYWNIDCSLRIVQSSSEILGTGVPKTISFIQYLASANHFPLCLKFYMRNLHFIEGLHLKAYAMLIPDLSLAKTDPLSLFTWENMGHQTANLAIVHHCKMRITNLEAPQVDIKTPWRYVLRFINMFASLWPRNLYSGNLS